MSSLIEQAGEDEKEAQKALQETEAAALVAQNAIKEALATIGAKLATVRRLQSEPVRVARFLLIRLVTNHERSS